MKRSNFITEKAVTKTKKTNQSLASSTADSQQWLERLQMVDLTLANCKKKQLQTAEVANNCKLQGS